METMKRFKRVLSCMLSLFLVYSTLILIRPIEVNASVNDTSGYELITEAKKHLGTQYVYGGQSPGGFDCSGFTMYVFSTQGIALNRTASTQYSNNGYNVSRNDLTIGDLIFFSRTDSNDPGVSHVGIYIGYNHFIHSGNSGVQVSSLNQSYWGDRYYGAKRILSSAITSIEILMFDLDYYYYRYDDLKTAIGPNDYALFDHWLTLGIKEGRTPSAVFDPVYYMSANADVRNIYGSKNWVAAYQHFVFSGVNEGRASSPVYNGLYYKNYYTDLNKFTGLQALSHYVKSGIYEGRRASSTFDPLIYKSNYSDLRALFGNDNKMYTHHYLKHGRSEGRIGI